MSNFDTVRANIKDAKFILCDISASMCCAWDLRFNLETTPAYKNFSIYRSYFDICIDNLRKEYPNGKFAIVSPANSYGLMDGGYDQAIINYFGKDLQHVVQKTILDRFCGEQPVGTAFAVNIPNYNNFMLIHTPTMRKPEVIDDHKVVYHCTRSAVIESLLMDRDVIVLPAFGGLTGQVPHNVIAYYMECAFAQLMDVPYEVPRWRYVYDHHPLSKPRGN